MLFNILTKISLYICIIKVINSIFHQYRELYYKINGILPTEFPLADDQLTYIFEFYKTIMKRLEIYKNLQSGAMTKEDYILKAKE